MKPDSDFHIIVMRSHLPEHVFVKFELKRTTLDFDLRKDDWEIMRKVLGCGGASAQMAGINVTIDDQTP